ncbi:MAG: PIN domain-containing protein [Actinomycetota bacterium]
MILLDSSALIGLLVVEPAAVEVESILLGGDAAIASANLAESIDVLVRVFGNELGAVEAVVVPLLATSLPVVAIGEAEARKGAEIRISHYHRQTSPLSLADCLLIGAASLLDAAVATTDGPVARAARSEGLEVLALRDPSGGRP